MNNDLLTSQLRSVLQDAGLEIRHEAHLGSLSVEFTTSPPLFWGWARCDEATCTILDSQVAGWKLSDLFSAEHDRQHSYWSFRLEVYEALLAE